MMSASFEILPSDFLRFFRVLSRFCLCKHRQRISPLCGVFFVVKVTVRDLGFYSWVSSGLPLGACEADPGHFVSLAAFLRAVSSLVHSVPI